MDNGTEVIFPVESNLSTILLLTLFLLQFVGQANLARAGIILSSRLRGSHFPSLLPPPGHIRSLSASQLPFLLWSTLLSSPLVTFLRYYPHRFLRPSDIHQPLHLDPHVTSSCCTPSHHLCLPAFSSPLQQSKGLDSKCWPSFSLH